MSPGKGVCETQCVLTAAGCEQAVHLSLARRRSSAPEKDAHHVQKSRGLQGRTGGHQQLLRPGAGLHQLWTFARDPLVESEPQLGEGGRSFEDRVQGPGHLQGLTGQCVRDSPCFRGCESSITGHRGMPPQ